MNELIAIPANQPGLIVPPQGLILPRHVAEARAEQLDEDEASRPWFTPESLYLEIRDLARHPPADRDGLKPLGGKPISRGRFMAQLRKAINRGLVECRYEKNDKGKYERLCRLTKAGQEGKDGFVRAARAAVEAADQAGE